MPARNEVAILDFGSQYTHLIARRVRELGVVSRIYPNDVAADKLKNAVGIILSGGPRSIVRDPKLSFDARIFKLKIPLLGLCYGHQLMADRFGGRVESGRVREYGLAKARVSASPLFAGVPGTTAVWMSHGDHVAKVPPGFKVIARSGAAVAAMADEINRRYGLQFHPEVAHTNEGKKILSNFIFKICGADKNWSTAQMLKQVTDGVKKQAGNKNVFLLVSGGVDSTVCFTLLEKILGKNRVYGLHIDNGFMRLNETKKITRALNKLGFNNLHIYDAAKEFLDALRGVVEPEQKRKIIGGLFLDITDRIMKEKKLDSGKWLLGQGTIYPDTIESGGTKNADLIKTHHNRVPRVLRMIAEGKIIEPIKELYKDEVREIGLKLRLPRELIFRHPFPGPGLAIRCLCSTGSDEKPKKIGASLLKLPVKSVGVQGDERSYAHPAVLQMSETNFDQKFWQRLRQLSPRITNRHRDINRVLLLAHGREKNLRDAKVRPAYLTKKRLDLLRRVDNIVNQHIRPLKNIWQMPVVLIPFGHDRGESIVLRPVESEEAMTVSFAAIPSPVLKKIIQKIERLKAVDFIFYDLTNKPPGTIEWE